MPNTTVQMTATLPAPEAPPVPPSPSSPTGGPAAHGVFPKLRVGQPAGRYEREADAVARAVTTNAPAPVISTLPADGWSEAARRAIVETDEEEDELLQTRRSGPWGEKEDVPPETVAAVRRPGGGAPVPESVRRRVEPRLGADLSGVRVHTDTTAATAVRSLHARAFTHRNHIFLGRGESTYDLGLMAHEATHVVQQDEAPATVPQVQRFSLDDLPGIDAKKIARRIPGFTLVTVLVGYNPVSDSDVVFNAENLFQGFVELLPFGADVYDALKEYEVVQEAFEWIRKNAPDITLKRVWDTLKAAADEIGLLDVFDTFDIIEEKFTPLYGEVKEFFWSTVDRIVELVKEAAIGVAEGFLTENGLWPLVKKVLGYDPLRDEEVEATPTEILEDFLLFIDKEEHLERMREQGTVEETAKWLTTQIETFTGLIDRLGDLFTEAWKAIQPENLLNLATNLRSLATQVLEFVADVGSFAWTVAEEVFARVKDALLGWLSEHVDSELPGFDLLTVIIGRNPFTSEEVPRTAANLVRGFITLLPGGHAIHQQLAESGVLAEAGARIEGAVERLGISWELIRGLFAEIWDSITIEALAEPFDTVLAMVARFGEPVSRLLGFVNVVLREVFFLVLAAMDFPVDLIQGIVARVMQAIDDVKRDPVAFLSNMLEAVKLGFSNFFDNALTHLGGGLVEWLFRGLRDAGLEPPDLSSLESVLSFALDILGVSVEKLWEKLGERIGEENVERIRGAIDRLTGIWNFVKDVQERGVAAIWEYIEGQISGLWDSVLEMAEEWIMERVVERAATWLLSLVDPTGVTAIINSFRAVFNAISSAIEYARDILAIVHDYVSTVGSVARGDLESGAKILEEGLAKAIPVAIGFLAKQLGIGDLGEKIVEIVGTVRAVIDEAIDWLIDRAMRGMESILSGLGIDSESDEDEATTSTDRESWWMLREPIEVRDQKHTLLFEGDGIDSELVVRSDRTPLVQWVEEAEREISILKAESMLSDDEYGKNSGALSQIRTLASLINKQRTRLRKSGDRRGQPITKRGGRVISRAYRQIHNLMKRIKYRGKSDARPPTQIPVQVTQSVTSTSDQIGKVMVAQPLSTNSGGLNPRSPGGDRSKLYTKVKAVRPGFYVQAHLLSDQLHGPNDSRNLTPFPNRSNGEMERAFESDIKKAVDQENKVVSYRVQFVYGRHGNPNLNPYEREVPTAVFGEAYEMKMKRSAPSTDDAAMNPNNWKVDRSKKIVGPREVRAVMPGAPAAVVIARRLSLSEKLPSDKRDAAIATLVEVTNIGPKTAEEIVSRLEESGISSLDELMAVSGIGKKRADAILSSDQIIQQGSSEWEVA
ncbi:DUF4157 domain-containing protein [Halogeometricum sp. S1BR25-6]|uniref:DUF4157 domain-containing protein n=1 Tax=Halogeometricum salsisoli TaxID=2950536 RepID=A0ABU2GJY3_9EURY|nr:DUF4157 domain-containing protein [Halogeometricum sp. S1BR25-6]MDS0301126.1 DUF4157 domain-containing protein [Halogeometricum sp. S1BR25-6]